MISSPTRAGGSSGSSLTARIVDAYGRMIVSGGLAPGEVLEVGGLPPELGRASRNVWREAIRVLATLGLVRPVKRKGTLVTPSSAWRALDPLVLGWIVEAGIATRLIPQLQGFREIVEPGAAEAAALHRSEADVEALRAALAALETLSTGASDDPDADIRFHLAVLEATGNPLAQSLKPTLAAVLRLSLSVTLGEGGQAPRREALALHAQIVEAIIARNGERARRAMLETLRATYRPYEAAASVSKAAARSRRRILPVEVRGKSATN